MNERQRPERQLADTLATVRERPGSTTAEIEACIPEAGRARAGVTRTRALGLLRELERRGLVTRRTAGRAVRWEPREEDAGLRQELTLLGRALGLEQGVTEPLPSFVRRCRKAAVKAAAGPSRQILAGSPH